MAMGWDDDYYEEYDDTTAFDDSDLTHEKGSRLRLTHL